MSGGLRNGSATARSTTRVRSGPRRRDQCRTALSTCALISASSLSVAGLECQRRSRDARRRRRPAIRRLAPLGEQPPADVGDPQRVEELRERRVSRRAPQRRSGRPGWHRAPRPRSRRLPRRRSSPASPRGPRRSRRTAASRAISGSSASLASSRWRTSSRPTSATKNPRLTSKSTRPSPARRRNASRTEPREMPSRSASSPWARREPGASAPVDDQRPDLVVGEPDDRPHPERACLRGVVRAGTERMVDIRCSNLITWPPRGRKWISARRRHQEADRMSQEATSRATLDRPARQEEPHHDPRGRSGARDRPDVLGRPHPRRRLAPRHRSRLERDARRLDRRPRRARDRLHDLALRSQVRRRRGGLRVPPHGAHPWVGVLLAGFFFVGALFLGGGGIYLGLGILIDGFWTTHISDSGPAWWVWGMIALAVVLVLNYFGIRLAIRAMLTFAVVSFVPMLILAVVIIAKGGENGNTLTMFNPSETSLFGITGGGVLGGILLGILLFVGFEAAASIGEESEDPHTVDSPGADRHRRGGGGLLRAHGLCLLDRLRQGRGVGGRLGVLARPRQRDGDEVRRLVVRRRFSSSSSSSTRWRSRSRSAS